MQKFWFPATFPAVSREGFAWRARAACLAGFALFCFAPPAALVAFPFPHELGAYTTWYESGSARAENIALAAARLDGVILQPGAEFSFNESVTWRIPRAALAWATALIDGEPVLSPGGGLCQVSSTLYAAALRAGLEISSRRAHSSPVEYIAPGLDATVSSSAGIDLRLRQPFSFPVLLEARAERGVLSVSLRGAGIPRGTREVVLNGPFRDGPWLETVVERVLREPGRAPFSEIVSHDRYRLPADQAGRGER